MPDFATRTSGPGASPEEAREAALYSDDNLNNAALLVREHIRRQGVDPDSQADEQLRLRQEDLLQEVDRDPTATWGW